MKKFLIIGNANAITYKEIFPLIKENKLWMGVTLFCGKMPYFEVPLDTDVSRGASHYYKDGKLFKQINSIAWYTNLDHKRRNTPIDLYKHYNADEYPKYDNYNGIEVSKTCDIPLDYDGIMGVPITFLSKYCPEQFEIIKFRKGNDDKDLSVNGKCPYFRILIKKVKEEDIKEPNDVALLMQYNKKFLIIGNMNAITYKEIFPLIKDNRLWLGTCYVKEFVSKAGEIKKFGNILWYTNLTHSKRTEPIDLYKCYNEEEYQKYDNYNAINVKKVDEIPMDYDGVIGVPITFLGQYCPTQFEIIGIANSARWIGDFPCFTIIDGKKIYNRILIKRVSK